MKRQGLLLLIMLLSIISYGQQAIQGTVLDQNNNPVPNHIVYVTDTGNVFPGFTFMDTTNISGQYSIPVVAPITNGTPLLVSTASCGIMISQYYVYQSTTITHNFSICTTTPPGPDTISGKVYLGTTTSPAILAKVYLIEEDSVPTAGITLTAVDSAITNQLGEYQFIYVSNNIRPVLVKAALQPSHPSYLGYLPTYYDSALNWSNAFVANGQNGTADIYMIAGVNPGGPGFIGGLVVQGANKTTGVGDPLNNRLILLTTGSGQAVAYTYSDASGNFSFSGLAYGTYKLFGDRWGKQNPPLSVTLSAANPSITNIKFEENSGDFTGSIVTAVNNIAVNGLLKVYPNPVTDQLIISGLEKIKGQKTITLSAVTGAVIFNTCVSDGEVHIPAGQMAKAMYVLSVQTKDGTAVYNISK